LELPESLRYSWKLCHYAKGPISEGAVIERSEMTESFFRSHFFYQSVTFRFMRFVVYYGQHGSPWLHWNRQDV